MNLVKITQQRVSVYLGILLSSYFIYMSLGVHNHDSHWINRLDHLFYDARFNLSLALSEYSPTDTLSASLSNPSNPPIVILDIDEQSLASEGRWPWSRHKLAQLIASVAEAGAVVVAFDVVFSEPERNPVNEVNQHLVDHDIDWAMPEHWQEIANADRVFANQMRHQDVVLGYFFQSPADVKVGQLTNPVYQLSPQQLKQLVTIERLGFTANLLGLQQAATAAGFVSTFTDVDGVIRKSPLVIRHQNQLYPSLALAVMMRYLLVDGVALETESLGSVDVITAIKVAGKRIQTDASGRVIIPYQGHAHRFPYLSISDVLQQRTDLSILDGAIVLIGASAIGLADLKTTPVGTQYPGVEVHATLLQALLDEDFPYRPEWEAGLTLVFLLVLGVVLSLLLPRLGPVMVIIVSVLSLFIAVIGNVYLWHEMGLDLPLASIVLIISALTLLNLAYGYVQENHSRRLLTNMFHQYVPKAHIDRMVANPSAYQFNGESKELTVLFADIRNFTTISEGLTAEALKALLNQYFTPITKIIFDHEGTIDKYVGDMVMAFWGAPLDDQCHAQHAVLAALAMQKETQRLSDQFVAMGLPAIHVGVGLNTGLMNVGDMGSTYRRAYTVIGDAVNLGSRLESITKYYGADILVGENTASQCEAITFAFVDRIQVKGKDESVAIYQPLGLKANMSQQQLDELAEFAHAYHLYCQQNWDEALHCLTRLKSTSLNPVYDIYIDRINTLRHQQLPDDWNGVFKHNNK